MKMLRYLALLCIASSAFGQTQPTTDSTPQALSYKDLTSSTNKFAIQQSGLNGAVPISVYTTATGAADCATDVSADVNALVTAGYTNILIPATCKYFPTGNVTPTGVAIWGEDARSSLIEVASPNTTVLNVGPYGSLHRIGVQDSFCYAAVTPANTAKTCVLEGDFYNSTAANANAAIWGGQGFYWIGGNYVSPDGSASTTIDVPGVSLGCTGAGGDCLYVSPQNTSGFGTSGIRCVNNGPSDNCLYIFTGGAGASSGVIHQGIFIKDYNNNANGNASRAEYIDRVGDSTGTGTSLFIGDGDSLSSLNTSPYVSISAGHQTSGNLLNIYQATTPFSGDVDLVSMGNASGTFTGKFEDFFNNSVEEFKVDSAGNTLVNGTLTVNGTASGTGLNTYLASPPAIGGSVAAAGSFTTLGTSGLDTLSGGITFGNISSAASPLNGWGLTITGAGAFTDTSGSGGTIANTYLNALPGTTFKTTTTTTYTTLYGLYINTPTCAAGGGGTPTCPNIFGLGVAGGMQVFGGAVLTGGTVYLNPASGFTTQINAGTTSGGTYIATGAGSSGVIQLGNASHLGNTSLLGISTGTNADFLCLSSAGVVLLQSTACTISSRRFKERIVDFKGDALARIAALEVASYNMKADAEPNHDPNFGSKQIGLLAENIAQVLPECAIYENDMKTPKSYRQECVIAMLVKGEQELMQQNRLLTARYDLRRQIKQYVH